MKRAKKHPVARCPRCGHRRRVEQRQDETVYRLVEHKRALLGQSWRCRGSGDVVAPGQVQR